MVLTRKRAASVNSDVSDEKKLNYGKKCEENKTENEILINSNFNKPLASNNKSKEICLKNSNANVKKPRSQKQETKSESTFVGLRTKTRSKKEETKSGSSYAGLRTISETNVNKNEQTNTCFASSSAAGTSGCSDRATKSRSNDSTSESDMDWEEVPDASTEQLLEDYNPVIPKEGVEITVTSDGVKKKRKSKGFDFALYAKRQLNRFKRGISISMHKVHLLGWIAHGIHINKLLNCENFRNLAFSICSEELFVKQSNQTSSFLLKLSEYYRNSISYIKVPNDKEMNFESSLTKCFETKTTNSRKMFCLTFILLARTLNLDVRLCFAAYPVSFKDPSVKSKRERSTKVNDMIEGDEKQDFSTKSTTPKNTKRKCSTHSRTIVSKTDANSLDSDDLKCEQVNNTLRERRHRCVVNKTNLKKVVEHSSSDESSIESKSINLENSKSKKTHRIEKKVKHPEDSDSDFEIKTSTSKSRKSASKARKDLTVTKTEFRKLNSNKLESNKSNVNNEEKIGEGKKSVKILSSDSEECELSPDDEIYYWSEIYLPAEKKWICVDILRNKIDKPCDIESVLPKSSSYIIAIDNKFYIKDITPKYASDWMTSGRKHRIDQDWWDDTLNSYRPPNDKKYMEEEKHIQSILLNKPLPKTVGEFKNHPLYVLKRHLLKFEGIYPEDAPTLGFIRGEPIYARECVNTLHSRETWMKQAKVVKKGEIPYKIVKARPKWDKMSGEFKTDLPLEIFGSWQTEDYIPPPAKDGKVPRNEYGNIELFQASMLPAGTVHLQLPGLNRIARKLGLDCAPALVGFDGHCGSVHPVFDGFIVCSEFKEVLLAAWDEEQENIRKREEEKREKRIYDNWKKLIKGLLIREKIKLKYGCTTSKE